MNTNNNVYTVIYTTVVCVLVAAVLAFVSQSLKPRQEANEKAETISQILAAAQFDCAQMSNDEIIAFYKENIASSKLVDAEGKTTDELDMASAEVYSVSDLKKQNYNIKDGAKLADATLPVYVFNNGITVIPVYGAGLWGPVWGYVAFESDLETIKGAYFDHSGETPGLGGKIKDDPAFREAFAGKKAIFGEGNPFNIVKGGAPAEMENGIDAITGATMTSKGVEDAINVWFEAYRPYLLAGAQAEAIKAEAAAECTEAIEAEEAAECTEAIEAEAAEESNGSNKEE